MRLEWRRIPAGAFNHELVWLTVSVAAAAGGAFWLGLGLPTLRCTFLAVTGYPCLTCGATRCAIALVHGNFFGAWLWNPLALVALCGVALFDLYSAIVLLSGAPRLRIVGATAAEKSAVRLAVVILIAANWTYLLAHHNRY